MDKIKLQSRYRDVETYYTPISEKLGILTSNGQFIRVILDGDSSSRIQAVDFEGGPVISIGDSINESNKTIKSIKSCYLVELE